jgi:hypothetical protein
MICSGTPNLAFVSHDHLSSVARSEFRVMQAPFIVGVYLCLSVVQGGRKGESLSSRGLRSSREYVIILSHE